MIEKHSEFAATLSSLRRAGLELDPTDATKNMPRGFSEYSDHEHSESLKLKNIMVRKDLKPSEWWKPEFDTELLQFAKASKPLLAFHKEIYSTWCRDFYCTKKCSGWPWVYFAK